MDVGGDMSRRDFLRVVGAVVPSLTFSSAQSSTTDSYYPRTDRIVYETPTEGLTWDWTSVSLVQNRQWGSYVFVSTVV